MIIEWRGKIGYGDIVSPICYAQNQSEITGKLVNLQFYWPTEPAEFIDINKERCKQLVELLDLKNVIVDHIDDVHLPYNHTNYKAKILDWDDSYHNIYFPNIKIDPQYIVIGSPLNNKQALADYSAGKAWKDGLKKSEWIEIEKRGIVVDYTTPFDELVDILSKCRYYIGYHGSITWMARLFGLPMTVFSQDHSFTQWAFPWRIYHINDLDACLDTSIRFIGQAKEKRNEYIQNESLHRSRSS